MRAMGFFDRAKKLFGIGSSDDDHDDARDEAPTHKEARDDAPAHKETRAEKLARARGRTDRPPLRDENVAAGPMIEDALAAREDGQKAESLRILSSIDKGKGLRLVLHAAALLEAGDEGELRSKLAAVAAEAEGYRLALQIAQAFDGSSDAAPWIDRALQKGAPPWAIAWTRALSRDDKERREGLVELLFADAPLARVVGARDLHIEGAAPGDTEAVTRYASFAHGRDTIRRFGAREVAALIARAGGAS